MVIDPSQPAPIPPLPEPSPDPAPQHSPGHMPGTPDPLPMPEDGMPALRSMR